MQQSLLIVIRNLQYLHENTLKHQNKALSVEVKHIIQNRLLVPLYFQSDQQIRTQNTHHYSSSTNKIIA